MGAGSAHAQIDYLYSANHPITCIALSYKFRHSLPLYRYETLQAIEGMQTPESILALPRADLITDVMGILTYVDNPQDYIRAYVDRLRPGGKLMIYSYGSSAEFFSNVVLESGDMVPDMGNTDSGLIFKKRASRRGR